jgi:hypothetical protein
MTRSERYDGSEWVAENRAAAEEADAARCNAISEEQAAAVEREQALYLRAETVAVDAACKAEPDWAAAVEEIVARGQYTDDDKRMLHRWDALVREYEQLLLDHWRTNGEHSPDHSHE